MVVEVHWEEAMQPATGNSKNDAFFQRLCKPFSCAHGSILGDIY